MARSLVLVGILLAVASFSVVSPKAKKLTITLPYLLKVANLKDDIAEKPPVDQFLPVTMTASNLETYLDGFSNTSITESDLNALCSDVKTVGQMQVVVNKIVELRESDRQLRERTVESCFIPGLPSVTMMNAALKSDGERTVFVDEALDVFDSLSSSQRFAVVRLIKGTEEYAKAVEKRPDILNYVDVKTLNETRNIITPEFLRSAKAPRLPERTQNYLLRNTLEEMDDVTFDDLSAMNLASVLLGLDCELLNNINISSVATVLARYNQLAKSQPWRIFPHDLASCFARKYPQMLDFARSAGVESDVAPAVVVRDLARSVGGHVLSLLTAEEVVTKSSGRKEALVQIGRLSMPQIIATITLQMFLRLESLADRIITSWPMNDMTLVKLGSLSFYSLKIRERSDFDVSNFLKSFIGEHKLLCLDEITRSTWSRRILEGSSFGPISEWDEQTLYELGDFLVLLSPEELDSITGTKLVRIVPHLLRESFLFKEYDRTPINSDQTVFAQVCAQWLGRYEGASYLTAVDNLYRLYLRASETRVAMAKEIPTESVAVSVPNLTRNKRNAVLEDNQFFFQSVFALTRSKRQAVVDENQLIQAEDFFHATNRILAEMHKRGILNNETRREVETTIADVKATAAQYIQTQLDLSEPLDPTKLSEELANISEAQVLPQDIVSNIDDHMLAQGKEMALRVAKIINLRPVDINVTKDEFCSFFTDICETSNFDADRSVIFGPRETKVKLVLNNNFTCDGVRAAGVAASALTVEDLKSWSDDELWTCLETFGDIKWPLKKRSEVWSLLLEKLRNKMVLADTEKLLPRYVLWLGNLVETVVIDNPELLDLSPQYVDVLSLVGGFIYPDKVVKDVVSRLKEYNIHGKSFPFEDPGRTALNELIGASLGYLACGLSDVDLDKIMAIESVSTTLAPYLEKCAKPLALEEKASPEGSGAASLVTSSVSLANVFLSALAAILFA